VDIHRKPGYDPVELFVDPAIKFPRLKVGLKLIQKGLGFRYLMDVIPLNSALVKGSHGRITDSPHCPVFITGHANLVESAGVDAADVCSLILRHLRPDAAR
jgi:hypothetical protein